jgi:hypothetical protein
MLSRLLVVLYHVLKVWGNCHFFKSAYDKLAVLFTSTQIFVLKLKKQISLGCLVNNLFRGLIYILFLQSGGSSYLLGEDRY